MKTAVIVFPGSNCDRDAHDALAQVTGSAPQMIWHKDAKLPDGLDLVMVPGGFSYGDYLRCGAMAGNSPIIADLKRHADRGGYILGVCNGFQVLCETGLLPGALMRNSDLHFVCRQQNLDVTAGDTAFTSSHAIGDTVSYPVAHHDGNYFADDATLDTLEGDARVAFRYTKSENPNGSARDIAGILSENKRVLGMMPHPERAMGRHEGGSDGIALFSGLLNTA